MNKDIKLKRDACQLAESLLKTDENYLDKVIKLTKIGNKIHGQCWDTEFHVFGVTESDTDHLPIKKVREHCSKTMLENTDKEIKEVIASYKQDVSQACNEIRSKYKNV